MSKICTLLYQTARHLIVAVALQTGLLTYNGLVVVANRLLSRMSTRHGEAKAYRQKMRTAKSYEVQQCVRGLCVRWRVCVPFASKQSNFWMAFAGETRFFSVRRTCACDFDCIHGWSLATAAIVEES